MENSHDTQKMIEILEGIRKDFKEFQEKQNNLLEQNHKELLREIKNDQGKQSNKSADQLTNFKKMGFRVQSRKISGAISTDARNHKWMSSLGIASVGFSLVFVLPIIAPIMFSYLFPDIVLPIIDTRFLINLKARYILFCIIGTIIALIWNNHRLKKIRKQSLEKHFAEMRVLEEIYFN